MKYWKIRHTMRCFLNKQLFLLRILAAASCFTFLSKPRATDNLFWWCHVNSCSLLFMLCRCLSHCRWFRMKYSSTHAHCALFFSFSSNNIVCKIMDSRFNRLRPIIVSWTFLFCVSTATQNTITVRLLVMMTRTGRSTYQHTQLQSHFDFLCR